MRRGEIFWGSLLVLLGILFFLKSAGILVGDVFGWFWPLLIIVFGVWILMGGFWSRSRSAGAEKFSVPLQDAREASLSIQHGAGHIELLSGANSGDFLTGFSGVGMNLKTGLNDGKLDVHIEAGPSFIPFLGPEGGTWQYRLSPDLPITIKMESGASRLDVDLTDLRVTYFSFEGGASSLNLTLPARVDNALVDIEAGAATIDVSVPTGVGLRFRSKNVGTLNVDESRFPRRETGIYQSADYDSVAYHAEVTVDGGATSIKVH